MDAKYLYLCAVEVGDRLYAATIENHDVFPGDLVDLSAGIRGTVIRMVFIDTESSEYSIFTDFVAVDEIVKVYHHTWSKTEESEEK